MSIYQSVIDKLNTEFNFNDIYSHTLLLGILFAMNMGTEKIL